MSNNEVLNLHKVQRPHETEMPKMLIQRAEEIFPALKASTSCTVSLEVVSGSCIETNITSSDDTHDVISIKVEEIPEPLLFPAIKAEPEESTSNEHQHILDVDHPCPTHAFSTTLEEQNNLHGVRQLPTCNVCNKSFKGQSYLKLHQRIIHSGDCQFMCDVCDKSFKWRGNLIAHLRTHSGERPFNCDLCKKSFTQQSILNNHQLTHSGEHPFNCDLCKKSFTSQSNLKLHQRIHSGERPFNCYLCKKSFTRLSHVKEHQRTHTGKRQFICEVCDESFALKWVLKRHLLLHYGN